MQVFNEVSVLLVSYVLVAISDDFISVDDKYTMGYFYIFFSSSNIIYNLYNMMHKLFSKIIPLKRKKREIERQ